MRVVVCASRRFPSEANALFNASDYQRQIRSSGLRVMNILYGTEGKKGINDCAVDEMNLNALSRCCAGILTASDAQVGHVGPQSERLNNLIRGLFLLGQA